MSTRKSKGKTSSSRSKQRRTSSNKGKPRVSLKPLRQQLQVLTDRANQRVDALVDQQLPSRALLEARRTLARQTSRLDDETLFRSDLKTRKQINKEFARVQAFLDDYTSTVQGANNFATDLEDLKGAFKGKNGVDTDRINEGVLDEVFDTYRRVTEAAGGWERAVGVFQGKESLVGFGSEVLINNIYDMIYNNMSQSDAISISLDMIDEANKRYEEMSKRQVSGYDYGIVFDDETAEERRRFYTWRRTYNNSKR